MTDLHKRCIEIADKVEPKYRSDGKSCTSHSAKRWSAAYSAAEIALTSSGILIPESGLDTSSIIIKTCKKESPMIEPK